MEIHQFHIRPADFFTSNPALDMPGGKNKTSVLVSCCGQGDKPHTNGEKSGSTQASPLAHQQGTAEDIDPKKLQNGTTSTENKRKSTTFSKIFAWKKEST